MGFSIKKHIPNTITCCNLISGTIAITFAYEANYKMAFLFIILGAIFDFFDGMSARALKVSSPIGKELDSLADVTTFGVAPSMMVFSLLRDCVAGYSWGLFGTIVPYMAFVMAAFSALRLAKFNLDERQTSSFIGLPTPANALFWGALVLGEAESLQLCPYGIGVILSLIIIFSWLLVAEIPMFSLKFKNLSWKSNRIPYIFLIVSVLLLIFLGLSGLSAVIGWYIILSLLTSQKAR